MIIKIIMFIDNPHEAALILNKFAYRLENDCLKTIELKNNDNETVGKAEVKE